MKINQVIQCISKAAQACGYNAVVKGKQAATAGGNYPLAQIAHPTLRGQNGRNNGTVTLRTEVTLSRLAPNPLAAEDNSEEDTETEFQQQLYDDAMAIIAALEASANVCEVKCTSAENSRARITPHGDTSLSMTLDVKLKFRKQ